MAVKTVSLIILTTTMCLSALDSHAQTFAGKASYYGPGFHGRKCANGEVFDMYKLTCAHKTLPFGTKLKVTNESNGKSTIVTVTDRGPYAKGRIVDLSKGAAMEIDMIEAGVVKVTVEVIDEEEEPIPALQFMLYEPNLQEDFKFVLPKLNTTAQWAKTVR